MNSQRVLITGAAGRIGSYVRKAWDGRYDLALTDRKTMESPGNARVVIGDITDVSAMMIACEGVDTVVHLAADANSNAGFDASLLRNNIVGTHNVYRAASESRVKRIIFASSVHAVGAYPADVQVKWEMPVRPCCEYGSTKCYGEALGRYFSDRHGISFIAVRIGGVHGHHEEYIHHNCNALDILVSEADLTQLITLCVDAPMDLRWAIFHGLSNNRMKRLDISHAREVLGYDPKDEIGGEFEVCEIPTQAPLHAA